MSLTVETGAIVAGAESYVSVADCDTYHSNRGNTAWASTTTVAKESALRTATAYLDGHYRSRWKGYRCLPLQQPLEWPRLYVVLREGYTFPSDSVPQRLKDATCEAALRALSGPLAIDADASIQSKKIDVLETAYRAGAIPKQLTYQVIDQLLSDYLKPLGSCDAVRG